MNAPSRARPEAEPKAPPAGIEAKRDIGLLKTIIGFHLRRIQNHLAHNLAQQPEFDGQKSGQLSALGIIAANPGLSQVALAAECGFDKAITVVVIDALERNQWARRERDSDDRRRNLLFITEAGQAKLEEWIAVTLRNEQPIHDVLSGPEFAMLSELLDRIYQRCFNYAPD